MCLYYRTEKNVGEGGGDFGGAGIRGFMWRCGGWSVPGTEGLAREAYEAAARAVGKIVGATGGVIDVAGFSGFMHHRWFSFFKCGRGCPGEFV